MFIRDRDFSNHIQPAHMAFSSHYFKFNQTSFPSRGKVTTYDEFLKQIHKYVQQLFKSYIEWEG